MIPPKSDVRWLKLIKGEVSHNFKNVSAGLMLSRLNRQLSSAFGVVESEKCIDELHAFFTKYEQLLGDDIDAIFG